jgi:hypothetical protein
MPHPTKTDWEKAQQENRQRLARIGAIVKTAATETLVELKAGSTEIESLSRQSLADMIAELKATDAETPSPSVSEPGEPTVPPVVLSDATEMVVAEVPEPEEAKLPTWTQIVTDLLTLVNQRKAPWTKALLARLQRQVETFDTKMAQDQGERYQSVRPVVERLRSLLDRAYRRMSADPEVDATALAVDPHGVDTPSGASA